MANSDKDIKITPNTGESALPKIEVTGQDNATKTLSVANTGALSFDSTFTASSLIKSGGSSSEFLKADGSVDTSTYLTAHPNISGASTVSASTATFVSGLTIDGNGHITATSTATALVGVTDGNLIDTSVSNGNVTLNVDLSELADMTQSVDNTQDELVILDNGTQKRKLISEIPISALNNDGSALNPANFSEKTSFDHAGGAVTNEDTFVITDTAASNAGKRILASNIPLSAFNNDSGFITSSTVSSLTGGVDNRIATFSSADALNGEANLTFDGSTLALAGKQTITVNDDVSEAFRVNITDTDSTDDSTPFIVDGDGRVGIGTASPVAGFALTLNGDGSAYEGIAFQVGGSTNFKQSTDGSSFYFDSGINTGNVNFRVKDSSGNLRPALGIEGANYSVAVGYNGTSGSGLTPNNTLQVNVGTENGVQDKDDGILLLNSDLSIADGDKIGGIGFATRDGNIPSVTTEAAAAIVAYAAEDHSTGDKGGDLAFFTSAIDDDDDTASHERMRIDSAGNVGIVTASPTASLDVAQGGTMTLIGGADLGATTRTNDTRKFFRMGMPHYHNAEEPFNILCGDSSGTQNKVIIGGGTSIGNAATDILFNTAANDATTTGTTRMMIDESGNVGIGTTSPTSALHIDTDVTNPTTDANESFSLFINQDLSGSSATGGDREQGAIYVDVDSSTTGGDTSDEHRAYGVWADVRLNDAADSDLLYGMYGYIEGQRSTGSTTGTTTAARAGYFVAASDETSDYTISELTGTYGYANLQDSGTVTVSYGVRGFSNVHSSRTENLGATHGGAFEIDISSGRTNGDDITLADSEVVHALFDHNCAASGEGKVAITNAYLFRGDHSITDSSQVTNAWGAYITGETSNYFSGNIGIGTTSPNQKLTVEGTMSLKEQASANADTAAYGQLWVKSDSPNNLYFTNDAGNDVQITDGSSIAGGGGGSPGGSDTFIQYNNGGSFGATTFSYDDSSGAEQYKIDVSSSVAPLVLVQTGSGNAFEVHDDTDPDNNRFEIDQYGRVTIRGSAGAGYGAALYVGGDFIASGTVAVEGGTVSDLSFTNAQDTNTGMYFPAADNIGFSTGGTERFRFGSSGEILIGGSAAGSNGQVLTSGGSGAAVSWTTISGGGASVVNDLTDVIVDITNFTDGLLLQTNSDGSAPTTGTLSSANGNIGIGKDVLKTITSADYTVAIGYQAGDSITTGNRNILIGEFAGEALDTGGDNVILGARAGRAIHDRDGAVMIGRGAGENAQSSGVVFIGEDAGSEATGDGHAYNIAIGHKAGEYGAKGTYNVMIGKSAGEGDSTNTTECGNTTAIGAFAMEDLTTGDNNTAIGYEALKDITTASQSTAVGAYALDAVTTSSGNTAFGYQAMSAATTALYNTAVGYQVNYSGVTTGAKNTMIGFRAGKVVAGGGYNILIGQNAGDNITSGSENVVIGSIDVASATGDRQLSISSGNGSTTWLTGDSSGNLTTNADLTVGSELNIGNVVEAANTVSGSSLADGSSVTLYTVPATTRGFKATIFFKDTSNTEYQIEEVMGYNTGSGVDFTSFGQVYSGAAAIGSLDATNSSGTTLIKFTNGQGSAVNYEASIKVTHMDLS